MSGMGTEEETPGHRQARRGRPAEKLPVLRYLGDYALRYLDKRMERRVL